MDKTFLEKTMIFRGLSDCEIDSALTVLRSVEKKYEKDTTILYAGDVTDQMGLVMDGSVTIENNDIWGNRTVLGHVGRGGFFAETYAILEDEPMMVDVRANDDCTILFLKMGSIRTLTDSSQSWSSKIIANLLSISTEKNLHLSARSFHISSKTIRSRLMSYLNSVYLKTGSLAFDIPFDRQQLADYLNVERTALSKELGRMKRDGIIDYDRNHFDVKSRELIDM